MNVQAKITDETRVNMTSKGQVLLPKAIRDKIGFVLGGPVSVGINDRGEVVVRPDHEETPEERLERIRAAIDSVAGTLKTGFASTDEYMDFIRPYRHDPI